ncbi:unnamed protein product [Cuscuta epithymum]|uniref:DNA helicase Pif1-like 2B domain-containing protein n=1 Tax=Cuscuta epithymum TaxID=186058 RepID=A0AAV0CMV7_9ASTE|nr:unnamed protein product [Cuscuta epithymum]
MLFLEGRFTCHLLRTWYWPELLDTQDLDGFMGQPNFGRSDSNADFVADLHTPKFLNKIRASGVPNHELTRKVGTPIMLLRNIDHSMGLCNGTRLIATRLGNHILGAKIMGGKYVGHEVVIPRLSLTPSDHVQVSEKTTFSNDLLCDDYK